MPLKIVFVTSAQPSANPRMLKSAITLSELGYEVMVIYARISEWATNFDLQLFEDQKNIKWIGVGFTHQKSFYFYFIRARQKFWKIFNSLTLCRFITTSKSFTLYSEELENMALRNRGDLYIGHNLGALRAVILAAKKFNSKSIFDFEDFYSGEHAEDSIYNKIIKKYESKYLSKIQFATASSPLIANIYKSHYSHLKIQTFLNVFSINYAPQYIVPYTGGPLKIFWFSQYVGLDRGLQNILKAISYFEKGDVQFTILGNCKPDRKEYLLNMITGLNIDQNVIEFHEVVSEIILFEIMNKHHVGIASEVVNVVNRDVCLTNKIFSYILSGLALAITKTNAQSQFLIDNEKIGFLYSSDDDKALFQGLKSYKQNPSLLNQHRENALVLAKKKYNWESQNKPWLSLINDIILS
jgi:glycosyltransferase involved in cell wall biosynthesis